MRSARVLLVTLLFVLSNLNCSPALFSNERSLVPFCRDLGPDSLQPKLKWDWYRDLEKIPANYPDFDQVMAASVVGDINADGIPEVAFITFTRNSSLWFSDSNNTALHGRNGVLRVISGSDGKTIFSKGEQDAAPYGDTTPLLIDIDGDGLVEIIYLHYSRTKVIALNFDGSVRWTHNLDAPIHFCVAGFSASDLDGDGRAEIVVSNLVISESSGVPYIKTRLQNQTSSHHCHSIIASLDPSKPGESQIVNPSGIFSPTGENLAQGNYLYMSVADVIPNSPGLEIISTGNSQFRIYNGVTGSQIKSVDLSIYNELRCPSGIGGGPSTVGNFDGDESTIEIALATGRHLTIFNTDGVPIAISETQDCSSLATGVTSFDFNGDGKPEILYSDEEYFRIYQLVNGQLQVIFRTINPSGTLLEYPLVVDLDGNRSAEILVVSNNYTAAGFYSDPGETEDRAVAVGVTGIRAFESAGENWMPTRKVWNQYHYNIAGVTDNLRPVKSTSLESFTSRVFRRNAQKGMYEETCRKN